MRLSWKGVVAAVLMVGMAASAGEIYSNNFTKRVEDYKQSVIREIWEMILDGGCGACKASTGIARLVLSNRLVDSTLNTLGIGLCYLIIEFFGYSLDTCPGIINSQFE